MVMMLSAHFRNGQRTPLASPRTNLGGTHVQLGGGFTVGRLAVRGSGAPYAISARTLSAVAVARRPISCSRRAGFRRAGPQTLTTAIGYWRGVSTAADTPHEDSSYSRVHHA